jgi:hypothetical protein
MGTMAQICFHLSQEATYSPFWDGEQGAPALFWVFAFVTLVVVLLLLSAVLRLELRALCLLPTT